MDSSVARELAGARMFPFSSADTTKESSKAHSTAITVAWPQPKCSAGGASSVFDTVFTPKLSVKDALCYRERFQDCVALYHY